MRSWARRAVVTAALLATAVAPGCADPSHQPNSVAMSGAVTGYLGVVPSAVVRAEHSESALHPSAPTGDAHLIVALFDAGTGARIQDAAVEAVVRGERHRALRRIRLEPMRINDTVTYGGFVSFARNDRYHVNVIARRPGSEETQLQFVIDARALPRPGG